LIVALRAIMLFSIVNPASGVPWDPADPFRSIVFRVPQD